ncbi:DUF3134 family protein [Nostoc sp. FACHB-190]|uniref:DUF3134 family protein n=1 Tax=Nostoc sp. FACHB-190 TaxID=2692838 RepID=UPI001682EF9A|nr:DUF3134 family protein [Nostoc sp. FACHB-190]MBD2303754.1 DUF3134 family protein [Nostoc sp. FACHB-190]
MVKLSNPALHEEPRYQSTAIIALRQEQSLLDWLASTGRLEPYVFVEHYYEDEEDDEEEVVEQCEYETGEIDHLEE